MCSVVGYIGNKPSVSFLLEGLSRLEYRGYDSAGVACLDDVARSMVAIKSIGGIDNLRTKLDNFPLSGNIGIGHTRWSTHGTVSEENTHPHCDPHQTVFLAHNGVIENYMQLKKQLASQGHLFYSETDTEVLAHLFGKKCAQCSNLLEAVQQTVAKLQGAYAFTAMYHKQPDTLIAVRKGSPLCVGVDQGQMFVASDITAFSDHTRRVIFLPDESYALITVSGISLYTFSGEQLYVEAQEVDTAWVASAKNGFEHYMLKEIYEQKRVIRDTVDFCKQLQPCIWQQCGLDEQEVAAMRSLTFIGCGTSAHAARIGTYFFEECAQVMSTVEFASEFRYDKFFKQPENIYCFLSQSGETADTLEALRLVTRKQEPTLVVTNVSSSSMVREGNGCLLTQARQEIAVASTKSFTAQVALLFWLSHQIAHTKGLLGVHEIQRCEQDLIIVADVLESSIERYKQEIMHRLAPYYAQFQRCIFLGRHISYAFAQEASLKLKEITYTFVECCSAGELKHGILALVEQDVPVVIFSILDERLYHKLLISAQQVKARGGHILVFAFEGQDELIELADEVFIFPRVHPLLGPIAMTGVMQYLVYAIARVLDRPIDKPRNLAKSVTVE